jgi:S-adenosylmethionine:tRNA ribosyltransferase-isomerase
MTTATALPTLDFQVPAHLEAGEPPEARGLARDQVRLMVSYYGDDRIVHASFRDLPECLDPGDVLVINTSGTLNASLPARLPNGSSVELHLSTHLPGDLWTVEVRLPDGIGSKPYHIAGEREELTLPAGGSATLLTPYRCGCGRRSEEEFARLWLATLDLPLDLPAYLESYGSPIRYSYVQDSWPGSYYQTVYATEPGSAEMPSAGRPFTAELLTQLVARGVLIGPLVLHTGVASLESHEPPYEEWYRVPLETARLVNRARAGGHRVIAIGTTVVRALETVIDSEGTVHPGEGWTCTVVSPSSGLRSVDGLLTGLHEPRSSHLMMLEALCGRDHLRLTYAEALREGYLWHEFGDVHLLLP